MKATFGGPGFQRRTQAHDDEIGSVWAGCGATSDVGVLERVLLTRPPDALGDIDDLDASLMAAQPDLPAIHQAAHRLADAFEAQGVDVCWIDALDGPPNLLFARDLFFMTGQGAVVARMAGRARVGEERIVSLALAQLGVPILSTVTDGTFEGADALFLDDRSVVIGVGLRTSPAAAAQVAQVLERQDISTVTVPMPVGGAQHLLGVVVFLDRDLAAIRADKAAPELVTLLEEFGYTILRLPDDDEMTQARGLNVVVLRPREVLMPTNAPGIRAALEAAGVTCHEVDVHAYLAAGGAMGCATGILRRKD
ncbi:MAG: amidinotransferase [Proteobacteria bacterium]|nr:amidinotransferase [Pseudomonadota bacterium]MCP4915975.1 amidinotransferase [Pseudomonadota bacterium]